MKAIFLVFLTSSVFAQVPKDVTFDAFNETLTPAGATRASRNIDLLVGVAYGSASSPSNIQFKIANPDNPKNNKYCLSARSRDGLYAAKAQISIQNYLNPEVQFEIPTKQLKIVNDYKHDELARLVFEEKTCDSDKAKHIIPVFSQKIPAYELRLYLNAPQSRLRTQVMTKTQPLSTVISCTDIAEGAKVGFTHECRIQLEKSKLVKDLSLIILETNQQGANQTKSYSLSLPLLKP